MPKYVRTSPLTRHLKSLFQSNYSNYNTKYYITRSTPCHTLLTVPHTLNRTARFNVPQGSERVEKTGSVGGLQKEVGNQYYTTYLTPYHVPYTLPHTSYLSHMYLPIDVSPLVFFCSRGISPRFPFIISPRFPFIISPRFPFIISPRFAFIGSPAYSSFAPSHHLPSLPIPYPLSSSPLLSSPLLSHLSPLLPSPLLSSHLLPSPPIFPFPFPFPFLSLFHSPSTPSFILFLTSHLIIQGESYKQESLIPRACRTGAYTGASAASWALELVLG